MLKCPPNCIKRAVSEHPSGSGCSPHGTASELAVRFSGPLVPHYLWECFPPQVSPPCISVLPQTNPRKGKQRQLGLSELGFFFRWDLCSPLKAAAMSPNWKGLFMQETKRWMCAGKVNLGSWYEKRVMFAPHFSGRNWVCLRSTPFSFSAIAWIYFNIQKHRAGTWSISKNQRSLRLKDSPLLVWQVETSQLAKELWWRATCGSCSWWEPEELGLK